LLLQCLLRLQHQKPAPLRKGLCNVLHAAAGRGSPAATRGSAA
jgi:hypothetical protein